MGLGPYNPMTWRWDFDHQSCDFSAWVWILRDRYLAYSLRIRLYVLRMGYLPLRFLSSWRFRPTWKILYSQNGNLPQVGVKIKKMKPPPSYSFRNGKGWNWPGYQTSERTMGTSQGPTKRPNAGYKLMEIHSSLGFFWGKNDLPSANLT